MWKVYRQSPHELFAEVSQNVRPETLNSFVRPLCLETLKWQNLMKYISIIDSLRKNKA